MGRRGRRSSNRAMEPSLFLKMGLALLVLSVAFVHGNPTVNAHSYASPRTYIDELRRMQSSYILQQKIPGSSLPDELSPTPAQAPPVAPRPNVYKVTSYGADPTGKTDSMDAISRAITDALEGPTNGFLIAGIANLGGARIDLEGGNYLISRPLQLAAGKGNLLIHGGTLKASDTFPGDRYLIELSSKNNNGAFNNEFVTLRDLLLDSSYRGGGIFVLNSLRTTIDNCYITHFTTNGVLVQDGHETLIRNSYLGQHITAGSDPGERYFSGTGIHLMGNDNVVSDVVIFSAAIGIMVSGQANTISGVHCYNKATGFGGTGIYLKVPGLTQTRIVHSYLDYTGIVAEDPVQLDIANCFFLGDAFIVLKSIKGEISGVNIVDNMFCGSDKGIDIVQLDQRNGPFNQIHQVVVDRNNVKGMKLRATVARGSVQGNGPSWMVDFNPILVFPDFVNHVQYTFSPSESLYPNHALRNISHNNVMIESDVPCPATVFVSVHQGASFYSS
ncbi:OLC1v1025484C1 [Oldenlandia corymbosa var. corymbosa]|uniref:OLC1v1025484C1 n=1 Tax=Oldenlandia corymbosa var. corymbosa TaxID=529605 RepID=A0AAV1C5J8_OLDCO|nr:OLC1v1025484C1 [Oldenlandia corymbosa var. corymbosa]